MSGFAVQLCREAGTDWGLLPCHRKLRLAAVGVPLLPWVAVIGAGVSAIVGGIFLGRYRFVDDALYEPAIDTE